MKSLLNTENPGKIPERKLWRKMECIPLRQSLSVLFAMPKIPLKHQQLPDMARKGSKGKQIAVVAPYEP